MAPKPRRMIVEGYPENGQVLVWSATIGAWVPSSLGAGGPHASSHQNNGSDEISVTGLSGVLADAQTPAAHEHTESQVTGLADDLASKASASALSAHTGAAAPHSGHELTSAKAQANGYAGLGADGKVPLAQLPPLGGGSTPAWHGVLAGAYGDSDPHRLLHLAQDNPINATPTNIAITVARCAYFRVPANLTVQKIRAFGVGATTNIYRCAIYRASDRARLTAELAFSTAAQAWVAIGSGLGVALEAGVLYFMAVSVNATGTTAGLLCISATTGRIGVLPTSWPGSLDIDAASPIIQPFAFAQFPVTAGALPATAGTLVARAAWTGGFPAFFLDSNNG